MANGLASHAVLLRVERDGCVGHEVEGREGASVEVNFSGADHEGHVFELERGVFAPLDVFPWSQKKVKAEPQQVHRCVIGGLRGAQCDMSLRAVQHLDWYRFYPSRGRILVAVRRDESTVPQVEGAFVVEPGIRGPQFLERFGNVVDFVSHVAS